MSIRKRDIAAKALGEASLSTERRLREGLSGKRSLITVRTSYDAIVDTIRDARDKHRPMEAHVLDAAMEEIRLQAPPAPPLEEFERGAQGRRATWRGVAAVAALVLIAVAAFEMTVQPVDAPEQPLQVAKHAPAQPPAADTTDTAAVDTTAQPREVFVELPALDAANGQATAISSLAQGLQVAHAGATVKIRAGHSPERLRIDKPVILVAIGGEVRIGK